MIECLIYGGIIVGICGSYVLWVWAVSRACDTPFLKTLKFWTGWVRIK